jgi:hypothetical protein
MYIKPSCKRKIPQKMGMIFSPSTMFQRKSDVEASKQGEVASQARKAPMFLSSKWNDLMKMWRMTSKVDDLLIMFSRNHQE